MASHETSGSLLRQLSAWTSSYCMVPQNVGPLLMGASTQTSPSISVRKETSYCNLNLSRDQDKLTPMAPTKKGHSHP
jgi:hypothetical protein